VIVWYGNGVHSNRDNVERPYGIERYGVLSITIANEELDWWCSILHLPTEVTRRTQSIPGHPRRSWARGAARDMHPVLATYLIRLAKKPWID
jgi:hypothetical protein